MAVHFDSEVGLYADTAEEVREQVTLKFTEAFSKLGILNTSPETPQGQLIDAITAMVVAKDSEIMYLGNQFNPLTASGVWQDALAKIYFINRMSETKTLTTCLCKGMAGTVIPSGSVVQDINGYQYVSSVDGMVGVETDTFDGYAYDVVTDVEEGSNPKEKKWYEKIDTNTYQLTQDTTVVKFTPVTKILQSDNPKAKGWYEMSGSEFVLTTDTEVESGKTYYERKYYYTRTPAAEIVFECTTSGAIECPSHSITTIVTSVSGWDGVDNVAAGVVGHEIENQSSFEHRRWAAVANNAHGTAYALEGALLALEEVQYCKVLNNRQDQSQVILGVTVPAHTVAICVGAKDETMVARTIYEKLDAGVGTTGPVVVSYTAPDGVEHQYNIIRPTEKKFYLSITIKMTVSTPASVKEDVINAIYNDVIGEGHNAPFGLGETIYASRFYVPAIKDAGVENIISIYIGFTSNPDQTVLEYNGDQYPSLSKSDIKVTLED